jgi:hypothetical protein
MSVTTETQHPALEKLKSYLNQQEPLPTNWPNLFIAFASFFISLCARPSLDTPQIALEGATAILRHLTILTEAQQE